MKSAAYLAVNPMGKVPALRDGHGDGAVVVTEAAAIRAYLAERFPDKGLAPPLGSAARAAYFRWMFFSAGPLEMATSAKALGWQVPPGREAMVGFGSYERTLDAIEAALRRGPHVSGETFSAADVVLGSALGWGMLFGTVERRRAFEAYVERLQQRKAYQRAQALNEARLAAGPLLVSGKAVRAQPVAATRTPAAPGPGTAARSVPPAARRRARRSSTAGLAGRASAR